jgi:RES domain
VPYDEPTPFKPDRMKPLRNSAHEGRVNPRGIPCLYAASNKETAVAEVRPWLGALVSVAQLGLARELRVVNCCDDNDKQFELYLEEPAPEDREKAVWRAIGRAFSEPVSSDPGIAEYVATQVLAEHFRKLGYDGVVYKSRLGTGLNFALFDLDVLEVADVRLYPVKAVRYEIGELRNSYVVKHKRLSDRADR